MIHSFFFISKTGEVIIEKHWRGVTNRSVCDLFWDEVNRERNREDTPPILVTSKYYLINIFRDEVFFVAATNGETPPLLVIEFLHRVFDIFEDYFGTVEEMTIKENFSTVYQLLEEMMDHGYPLTTEPNSLKAMIQPSSSVISRLTSAATGASNVSDVLPDGTISNMPWRKTGVKYSQNEIYLDIIEEIDSIVDRNGLIVSSEVSGAITANSRLSGVPDLALNFVNPNVIDDCSFHPCVRYNRFERDRVVSFVPPDGTFELMRYRVNTEGHVAAPCYCQPQFSFDYVNGQGTVAITVGHRAQSSLVPASSTSGGSGGRNGSCVVEDVCVLIPFSRIAVRTAELTVSTGAVLFDESTKVAKWTVGKLSSSGVESVPTLRGVVFLQSNVARADAPTVELQWKVASASVSGLSVASLVMTNENYRPYKGVRNISKSGKFQVRSA